MFYYLLLMFANFCKFQPGLRPHLQKIAIFGNPLVVLAPWKLILREGVIQKPKMWGDGRVDFAGWCLVEDEGNLGVPLKEATGDGWCFSVFVWLAGAISRA